MLIQCALRSILERVALDYTLAVSLSGDDEDPGWKVRWDPYEVHSETLKIDEEVIPALVSTWRPWKSADFRIRTSGFAASAQYARDFSIFEQPVRELGAPGLGVSKGRHIQQGWWNDDKAALVISESGVSGVVDLTKEFRGKETEMTSFRSKSFVIRADPNTKMFFNNENYRSIIAQRTLIPAVQHIFSLGASHDRSVKDQDQGSHQDVMWRVTGVFAIQASATEQLADVWKLWGNRPSGSIEDDSGKGSGKRVNLSGQCGPWVKM
ncbi:hypothetical protein K469DRAFT_698400 [Zopfia rhizophila CBS 207.26]|uniref:Uncharacterized protein n=1 Tax=Zopfia rhizophila CBS 207.26 TaxID=1314779 RepID=A0A6A6DBQ0_9PEZI|nr:hypothetical protein K469DRAFT_698400 [Zopfia rhizophila CBS 207.26]